MKQGVRGVVWFHGEGGRRSGVVREERWCGGEALLERGGVETRGEGTRERVLGRSDEERGERLRNTGNGGTTAPVSRRTLDKKNILDTLQDGSKKAHVRPGKPNRPPSGPRHQLQSLRRRDD